MSSGSLNCRTNAARERQLSAFAAIRVPGFEHLPWDVGGHVVDFELDVLCGHQIPLQLIGEQQLEQGRVKPGRRVGRGNRIAQDSLEPTPLDTVDHGAGTGQSAADGELQLELGWRGGVGVDMLAKGAAIRHPDAPPRGVVGVDREALGQRPVGGLQRGRRIEILRGRDILVGCARCRDAFVGGRRLGRHVRLGEGQIRQLGLRCVPLPQLEFGVERSRPALARAEIPVRLAHAVDHRPGRCRDAQSLTPRGSEEHAADAELEGCLGISPVSLIHRVPNECSPYRFHQPGRREFAVLAEANHEHTAVGMLATGGVDQQRLTDAPGIPVGGETVQQPALVPTIDEPLRARQRRRLIVPDQHGVCRTLEAAMDDRHVQPRLVAGSGPSTRIDLIGRRRSVGSAVRCVLGVGRPGRRRVVCPRWRSHRACVTFAWSGRYRR